jgi:molecular chaperone IbpA
MLPSDFTDPFGLEKLTRRTSIGFDDIIRTLSNIGSEPTPTVIGYPPYNIRKSTDNVYVLEMAVAGFGKKDIEITVENNVLSIKGTMTASSDNDFLHKGIAERNFHRRFNLAETVEIEGSTLENGMLKITMKRIVPQKQNVRTIKID